MSKVKLESICLSITDGSHSSPPTVKNGFPIASVKDMGDYRIDLNSCRRISKEDYQNLVDLNCKPQLNDVLIAKDGSYMKQVHVVDKEEELVLLSSIAIIRPNIQIVNPYYLKYSFLNPNTIKKLSNGYVSGSVIKRIILKDFKRFEIPLPPLHEQQKIASVLSALDDQIELNNKINRELEDFAQTLYNYWFVQFEFPNEEGKPYKSSGGKMVWNEELKREIPEGWEVDSFCENKYNSFSKEKVKDFAGVKKYIATGDVVGTAILNTLEEISFKNRPSRANAQPIKNTVWFAKMKDSKKTLLLTENDTDLIEETILSTGFCGISSPPEFLLYTWSFINNDWFESKKDFLAHGATQQAVNEDDLRKIKMLIPSDVVVEKFHKTISSIYLDVSNNRRQNQELIQLRDYLLPLLMNGQVGFSDEDK